jgi:ABC-type dipeptide/oligopeptide/nickel transport system permease component
MLIFVQRLGRLAFVFFVVTFVTFFLLDQAPGDPAERFAGLNATPEVIEGIRAELGLIADRAVPALARQCGEVRLW